MISYKVPLKPYNTFGISQTADCIITISKDEHLMLAMNSPSWKEPFLIMGGGSNLLFVDDFKGTIIYPGYSGIRIEKEDHADGSVIVSAGAGVIWDDLVEWTVNSGIGGLENLSLIPGKVGAVPVQNIGAYGVEVKDFICKVRTLDINSGTERIFSNSDCLFGYRESIFKKELKGKYIVTSVSFRLGRKQEPNLSYEALARELNGSSGISCKTVRETVIRIRHSKLPDPSVTGNAGSFFKNPIVSDETAIALKEKYNDIPVYNDKPGSKKIAAGWLIDRCGWKGFRRGDAGVHPKQALVLVNYGQATGREIFELSEEIRKSVADNFGITLEREAEVIGSI
jgi:UDP-N-acetylmuramate dehydrogenase